MNNKFEAERFTDWCNYRIKAILYPENLTEEERNKVRFLSPGRRNNENLLKEQREVLRKYDRKKSTEDNWSEKTRVMRLIQLLRLARFVKKPFEEATKDDVLNFFDSTNGQKLGTINNYKNAIKPFFQWLHKMEGNDYPECVKWITRKYENKFKLPEEILNEDDIIKMLDKANNPRNKALISVGYESGCRLSELLNIRMKHLTFDEYGAVIMVNGKTGQRRIRLINSVPDLKAWVNNHPFKDNPEAPLWISLSRNEYGSPIHRFGFNGVLQMIARRAGIKKRIHPHALRHARATQLAKLLTEQELKIFFGWAKGSQMASIYVHLSGMDVERKLLEKAGKLDKDKIKESVLRPRKCGRCGEENSVADKFCVKCYYPLEINAIKEIEELKSIINEFVTTKLLQKPGFMEELPKLVEEWSKSKTN